MTDRDYPDTVALTRCVAYGNDPFPVTISGLFDVIERETPDPAAGLFGHNWLICPHGSDPDAEPVVYVVDDYDFVAQVFPAEHAARLVAEREMDFCEEMAALTERDHG